MDIDQTFGIATTAKPEERYDAVAKRLLEVNEKLKELKSEKTKLEDEIWTLTPEEAGEEIVKGDQYSFLISRTELWKWDSKKIEATLALPSLPDHITVKFSVDKGEYNKLDAKSQRELSEALTVSAGKPRVKVITK